MPVHRATTLAISSGPTLSLSIGCSGTEASARFSCSSVSTRAPYLHSQQAPFLRHASTQSVRQPCTPCRATSRRSSKHSLVRRTKSQNIASLNERHKEASNATKRPCLRNLHTDPGGPTVEESGEQAQQNVPSPGCGKSSAYLRSATMARSMRFSASSMRTLSSSTFFCRRRISSRRFFS
jgi:hypothetical protein